MIPRPRPQYPVKFFTKNCMLMTPDPYNRLMNFYFPTLAGGGTQEASTSEFWPCFVTKQVLVTPNSTNICVIWSHFHEESVFWGPSDELMVEKPIYIENTDFIKFPIFQKSVFWWEIDIQGWNMDSTTSLEPRGPSWTPKKNIKFENLGSASGWRPFK